MEPCAEKATLNAITKTLEKLERGQERLVELLEKVANQDARINSLKEHAEHTHTELGSVTLRLREVENAVTVNEAALRLQLHEDRELLEVRLGKLDNVFRITTSRAAFTIYGGILAMIIAGTFLDLTCHSEKLQQVYRFIK